MISGMDTQSMVQQLMRAENMRMDRLTRRRQLATWRREDMRNTMNMLEEFRANNTAMNRPNATNNVLNLNNWNTFRSEVTSNGVASNGISVSGGNASHLGSVTIDVIASAQTHVVQGRHVYANQQELILDQQLSRLLGYGPDTNMSHNNTRPTGTGLDYYVREFDIQVNGTNVVLNAAMTVREAMDAITAQTSVTMRFDTLHNRFVMQADAVDANGTNQNIRVRDFATNHTGTGISSPWHVSTAGNTSFFTALGFGTTALSDGDNGYDAVNQNHAPGVRLTNIPTNGGLQVVARQAEIRVDDGTGILATRYSGTNVFADIMGMRVTINNTVNPDIPNSTQSFQINTRRDVSDTMDMIRNFVTEFNTVMRYLNTLHTTPRPRSGTRTFYEPLTDEQRQAMSDREVELWETRARTGLHHRDDTFRNLQQQLREWIQAPITLANGQRISLHEIGITTGYGSGPERLIGMLQIDDERLEYMLETRSDDIQTLFTQMPSAQEGIATTASGRAQQMSRVGLGMRMNHVIENAIGWDGTIRRQAGQEGGTDANDNALTRRIRDYDRRIADMQQFLLRRENQFFAMFARMESAMAQANAQMDSLWAFAGM
jgi:flagellar hook-associated protein 2